MKKIIVLTLICLILSGSFACSGENEKTGGEFATGDGEENIGIEIIVGNEPNNTVFWNNVICEDEDYVYVSSFMYYGVDINPNIIKISKSDDSVTDLGVRGNNLNIYDGCLYFLNEHNYLYKLDLSDANATPKGVTIEYIYAYMILDDKIYPSRFLSNVLSMNLDGSDLQEAQIDSFVIYGHDNEYIYVIYPDEKQTSMVDGREICVQYIYRMDYSHENKEKLFEVHNDVPNYFDELNGVMIISNGYAYYEIIDNDEWKLIRNLLTANPVRETIYSDETAFHIMAVTDEWIYVRQYIREDSGSYAFSVFKVSPDGKTKTEINFKKDDIPFFVGRFDNKLYYVENNKIFPFD